MINFVKAGQEQAAEYLSKALDNKIAAGRTVLWLVPGGSAMKVAAITAELFKRDPKKLTVTQTDERYGKPGHIDSNWQQLKVAGFKLPGAHMHPVLEGKDLEQTAKDFAEFLDKSLDDVDYSIALAGMGPDGHIFGIKPGSPAVDSRQLVEAYQADDFIRVTTTGNLLKQLDELVLFAHGKEKWSQFDKLTDNVNPAKQPAQLLKKIKKVTVYNDYKEGGL